METIMKNDRQYTTMFMSEYFNWLDGTLLLELNNSQVLGNPDLISYHFLFRTLANHHYFWSVPNDDNRKIDGLDLRSKFKLVFKQNHPNIDDEIIEVTLDRTKLTSPCSILEFLIGVAYRMESINDRKNMQNWFYELLCNLNLAGFIDDGFIYPDYLHKIHKICDDINNRKYSINGKGGLFPIEKTKKDQRKNEIWAQMNEYLMYYYQI